MSIQALPQTAVQAIAASEALVDPAAVVKELLDNALDARATSVAIDVSANTIDLLQVRDNGHGIAPHDRHVVAQRYCTSKIRNEADLAALGGAYLGFRGEALASAAEMSGGLSITTRVEGEPVAALLTIGQDGELLAQERASHAIGTTVRIENFLKTHPVRRQIALKVTAKCLSKIKQTLQAYAFARPTTRMSLKVVKATSTKEDWTFAPKRAGHNIEDTACKIVGKSCASQCTPVSNNCHGYELNAFLPKPDADASKINGIGFFLAIDHRPVSVTRGTLRLIAKVFKDHLRRAHVHSHMIKDPFMCLSIVCPLKSYDVNVEIAKDDVIFQDPEVVLGAVRELMSAAYPNSGPKHAGSPTGDPDLNDPDVGILSDRSGVTGNDHSDASPRERRKTFLANMFDEDDEIDLPSAQEASFAPEEDVLTTEDSESVQVSNPWILAKVNTLRIRSAVRTSTDTCLSVPAEQKSSVFPAAVCPISPTMHRPMTGLLTPLPSSPMRIFVSDEHWSDARSSPSVFSSRTTELGYHHEENSTLPSVSTLPGINSTTHLGGRYTPRASNASSMHNSNDGSPLNLIPNARSQSGLLPRVSHPKSVNKAFNPQLPKERASWFDVPDMRSSRTPRRGAKSSRSAQDNGPHRPSVIAMSEPLSPPSHNTDIRTYIHHASAVKRSGRTRDLPGCATDQIENGPSGPRLALMEPSVAESVPGSVYTMEGLPVNVESNSQAHENTVSRCQEASECHVLERTGNATKTPEKPHRLQSRKASQLSLDGASAPGKTFNVIFHLPESKSGIERLKREADRFGSLDKCNNMSRGGNLNALTVGISEDVLGAWSEQLTCLLQKRFPRNDMVQDWRLLLREALGNGQKELLSAVIADMQSLDTQAN